MKIIIEGTAEEIQALMQKELCCEQSSSNQWFPEDSNRKYYEKSTSGPNLKKIVSLIYFQASFGNQPWVLFITSMTSKLSLLSRYLVILSDTSWAD